MLQSPLHERPSPSSQARANISRDLERAAEFEAAVAAAEAPAALGDHPAASVTPIDSRGA